MKWFHTMLEYIEKDDVYAASDAVRVLSMYGFKMCSFLSSNMIIKQEH